MAWYQDLFDERYLDFYPGLRSSEPAQEDADFAARALALEKGARVLDLGCGTGRHAVGLALRGLEVTGLDLSAVLLEKARSLAARHAAKLDLVQRDMRDLSGLGPFQACVCLYTAFGFFEPADNERVLQQVARVLGPDGRLLLDLTNFPATLRALRGPVWRELPDSITREEHRFEPLTGYLDTERTQFFKDGRVAKLPETRVRAWAPHEVAALLEETGFEVLEVFGDLRGAAFDWERSGKQVFLAHKRAEAPATCPA